MNFQEALLTSLANISAHKMRSMLTMRGIVFGVGAVIGHSEILVEGAMSPGGEYAITLSRDRTAKLWDVLSGNEINHFVGHGEYVIQAAFSAKLPLLLTASNDATVRLWRSEPLSVALGEEVWMKMDCFQPVGSFKQRGMGRICQEVVSGGAGRIVSSSGGNAGYATAHAARALGVSCLVVVPSTTSEFMRERIRSVGAEVREHGASWDDAHAHAVTLAGGPETAYVHPFDHPAIWEGHASIVEESAVQGPKPGVVVVAVGGGGLLCGVLQGMRRVDWGDVPVVAVETAGAASFHASVEAGRLVTLDAIRSLATTLGARTVTSKLLEWKDRHEILHWIPTDRQAVRACRRFLDDHRVLVEPACGAALAVCYERCESVRGRGAVLVDSGFRTARKPSDIAPQERPDPFVEHLAATADRRSRSIAESADPERA